MLYTRNQINLFLNTLNAEAAYYRRQNKLDQDTKNIICYYERAQKIIAQLLDEVETTEKKCNLFKLKYPKFTYPSKEKEEF